MEPNDSHYSTVSDSTAFADESNLLHPGELATQATERTYGVRQLPKGALTKPTVEYPLVNNNPSVEPDNPRDASPVTPSHPLLEIPNEGRVQFASYPPEGKMQVWDDASDEPVYIDRRPEWVPVPLRTWFWSTLAAFLIGGAIALEVAAFYNTKNNGWPTSVSTSSQTGVLHYVYTLPPVCVAMFAVAMWAWTDIEIKKMQPYVDLAHGDSPPHRSLLLDYTRTNNFFVWTEATANKHYLVALTSLMVILTLSFQPLAAALFNVKDTWMTEPDVTLNNLQAISLNQNAQFEDLTSFLTAAGYASAASLYNLSNPPFINDQYTVGLFELPKNLAANGTIYANTTAIRSDPGCRVAQTNMTQHADGLGGWTNMAVADDGCFLTWDVNKTTLNLFGTSVPTCPNSPSTPPQFSPVVLWFFTYLPVAAASATICYPNITLWDVTVNIDLASGNLTQVTPLRRFSTGTSNFSSLSANVTGAPLNGRAYNGVMFNLTNPDQFVLARQNATQLQLPSAVFQAAETNAGGLAAVFKTDQLVSLSTQVYSSYLRLIAKTVYYSTFKEPLTIQVKTIRKRLWMSEVAVHLLAVAMILLALFGTIIHLFHRADRQDLHLAHRPGTIASAVSIGAQTGMGNLLAGRRLDEEINEVLHNKKFRMHPQTMKIVMEGEEGYETVPNLDRKKRWSLKATPLTPTTPRTPRTPRASAST